MPNTIDPAARDKYLLEVTAGPSYDSSTHSQVPVNSAKPTLIESNLLTAYLHVRIRDYHGLPPDSPPTCPYFQHASHTSDRYSISYSFVPKRRIAGSDLVMGFDYDHSVKHQLPPGTKTALKIATSWLDPGLYADPYAEEPYLYGAALSSWFAFSIGDPISRSPASQQLSRLLQTEENNNDSFVITEGATGPSGHDIRSKLHMPSSFKKRRKHFLSPDALQAFTFEEGRMYHADFFNPHLDFANFALRLPGFSVSVARYVDERTHHLRFVLKEKEGDEAPAEYSQTLSTTTTTTAAATKSHPIHTKSNNKDDENLKHDQTQQQQQPSNHAQIDAMHDSTVERYLQARCSNLT
ncbi:hypothetical protein J1614_003691 [Plenodomus biglobosus]|nr:hypothetical protein J1614_003691 [Plenodomus biglobosus]